MLWRALVQEVDVGYSGYDNEEEFVDKILIFAHNSTLR